MLRATETRHSILLHVLQLGTLLHTLHLLHISTTLQARPTNQCG